MSWIGIVFCFWHSCSQKVTTNLLTCIVWRVEPDILLLFKHCFIYKHTHTHTCIYILYMYIYIYIYIYKHICSICTVSMTQHALWTDPTKHWFIAVLFWTANRHIPSCISCSIVSFAPIPIVLIGHWSFVLHAHARYSWPKHPLTTQCQSRLQELPAAVW